jgi:parallel beta-helix repeat protein
LNNVGVLLNDATKNEILNVYSASNVTGVEIAGGSGNAVTGSMPRGNSQYGIWLDGSQGNTVTGNLVLNNNLTGIYLGCSAKGIVDPTIPCTITTTTGNTVENNTVEYGKFGIQLERKSIYNKIEGNDSGGNLKYDMDDGNGNCIYNTYLGDSFLTKNLPCIQ